MKKLSKKKLKEITFSTNDEGFTVWITEKMKDGRILKHWLLDASLIMYDGEIRLGNDDSYRINAVYNKEENTIEIVKKGKNE